MSHKKLGIIISYLNLVIGMLSNLFLVPFLITYLGDSDYSLFKVMQSFAGTLSLFHLGISTIVARSVVKCSTDSESYTKDDKRNTLALSLIASLVMGVCVVAVGAVIYSLIPRMYDKTFSQEEIALGQKMFAIFVSASIIHILTDAFTGCLIGHEKYAISSSLALFKTLAKVALYVIFVLCGFGVFYIVIADLIIALSIFVISVCYSLFVLREFPKLIRFDKRQMMEILSFGVAILLQSFVNQVNNNVDTTILGIFVTEKHIITMYSSALAIYSTYNSIVSVMSSFFLPKATKLVEKHASGEEITDFVIYPGRFQAMIAVACVFGFALFGRNFISIWIGESYMDAYWVILILMIPVTIPLVENAMISVLDASLKRIYRSIALVVMAVLNIIVSVMLVRGIGFWGAAIGTAASLIVGHGVLMNWYYAKKFGLQVGRLFTSIFKGILPAGGLTVIVCLPIAVILPNTIAMFLIQCVAFLLIYSIFLWLFGINKTEKGVFASMFKRIFGKKTQNKPMDN